MELTQLSKKEKEIICILYKFEVEEVKEFKRIAISSLRIRDEYTDEQKKAIRQLNYYLPQLWLKGILQREYFDWDFEQYNKEQYHKAKEINGDFQYYLSFNAGAAEYLDNQYKVIQDEVKNDAGDKFLENLPTTCPFLEIVYDNCYL